MGPLLPPPLLSLVARSSLPLRLLTSVPSSVPSIVMAPELVEAAYEHFITNGYVLPPYVTPIELDFPPVSPGIFILFICYFRFFYKSVVQVLVCINLIFQTHRDATCKTLVLQLRRMISLSVLEI